jgi:hypothetical protein
MEGAGPVSSFCVALMVALTSPSWAANSPRKVNRDGLPPRTDKRSIQRLSLDLKRTGAKDDFVIFWEKGTIDEIGSCGPIGKLHLKWEHGATRDDFDLGPFRTAKASVLEVPERNILLIETCGGGAAGGAKYDAFSLMDGDLYRIHLMNGKKGSPLIFAEYFSAGSPFAIRFIDKGLKLRTLTSHQDTHTITDYVWDGVNYSQVKQSDCQGHGCAKWE